MDDVAPSMFFFTCRGEKYVQYYTVLKWQSLCVKNTLKYKWKKIYLLGVVAIITLLQSGPMLDINCPISHLPPASPLPKPFLFLPPEAYTCNTIFFINYKYDVSTPEALSLAQYIILGSWVQIPDRTEEFTSSEDPMHFTNFSCWENSF